MTGEPEPHEYSASLRVQSKTLSRDELTRRLGQPTEGHDIGDAVSSGNPKGPKRRHSQWSLKIGRDEQSLREKLSELVEFAELHREALDGLPGDCDIDIFCGIFTGEDAQGGFTMPVDLLRRLADLQLEVTFDLY